MKTPQAQKEASKRYYEKNKERLLAYSCDYQKKNKEKMKVIQKRYNEKTRDQKRLVKLWNAEHGENTTLAEWRKYNRAHL